MVDDGRHHDAQLDNFPQLEQMLDLRIFQRVRAGAVELDVLSSQSFFLMNPKLLIEGKPATEVSEQT